jgi:hypothetical protein
MNRVFVVSLVTIFVLIISFNKASAGVVVFDDITPVNKSVKLKARTKGRFFAEGGRLVRFYVDETHIGTNLSGGDGYTFLKYRPATPGIKKLRAESDGDNDEGILLVTGNNEWILLIEIEHSFFTSSLSFKSDNKSKKAIELLSKNYRIIYISTLMGVELSQTWLKENGFPHSIVLGWEGGEAISELRDRNINIYAIIGSSDMLAGALTVKKRFSFEDTEHGTTVKDWDELLHKFIHTP